MPFDGSMILLRHYRASQTPNCSAYGLYYLTYEGGERESATQRKKGKGLHAEAPSRGEK